MAASSAAMTRVGPKLNALYYLHRILVASGTGGEDDGGSDRKWTDTGLRKDIFEFGRHVRLLQDGSIAVFFGDTRFAVTGRENERDSPAFEGLRNGQYVFAVQLHIENGAAVL